MSIKSDRWIRRMSAQGMIEPFSPGQVRTAADGHRIVSYGTSSYGYDVRCAEEFKIFTNINSTIVDPKAFDEKSFVDFKGPVCIIPPNSFALARTVEFFRIPRSVLTVCLGKSTYARCFSGDTRVALVDGSAPTLEEMARRHEAGEIFFGYSIGPNGRIIVSLLDAPRFIGRDSLLEIELDGGEKIRATPDHQFIRRDGQVVEAGNLRPGDPLMPLYREGARGYEMAYQPIDGHLYPTHCLADEWNLRHGIDDAVPGTHRFDPAAHGEATGAALRKRYEDPMGLEHFRKVRPKRAAAFWSVGRFGEVRQRLLHQRRNPAAETLSHAAASRFAEPAARIRHSASMRQAWAHDHGSRRALQPAVGRRVRLRPEITETSVRRALDDTGSVRGALQALNCDHSDFRRFPDAPSQFRGTPVYRNHKVRSIRRVAGEHDVFCLTVPEAGNFALEAGVFVKNCGIIVNVTPLEPEWEGHVTLEFSNTTPLPAKIYANEGVAQMLFFESDEVCETSYKDRGGKYQGQRGVTLPKT